MTLPEGWVEAPLAELTSKIGSGATPRGGREAYAQDGTPLIRSMNVHFRGFEPDGLAFIDNAQAQALANVEVSADDVLLNITGASIGRVCLAPAEMAGARVNQHVCIVRTKGVLPQFVQRFLASPAMQQFILEENYGLTRQALTKGMIEEIEIPIPPAAEQRRIVAKLDALTARLARARAELNRVPVLAERLRDAARERALFGELTANSRGGAAAAWPHKPLSEIARVVTGATPPTAEKHALFGGNVPFVKPTDLDAGYYVDGARETLTDEGAARSRTVPANSTLVTCIGATISKTGFVRIPCAFNQQINAVVPNPALVDPRWLYWAITSPSFRQAIIDNASATTLPIINKGRFQALTLPLPPMNEQRQVVSRLEAAFARADRMEAEAARARALLDRLEAAILAKAFRGELVPQDPNDEPAHVLLDRIRAERAAVPKAKRGRKKASA